MGNKLFVADYGALKVIRKVRSEYTVYDMAK